MNEDYRSLDKRVNTFKSLSLVAFVGFFALAGILAWNLSMLRQVGTLILDLQDRVERLERSAATRR